MTDAENRCDGCGKEVNFAEVAAGGCHAHKKDYCWECTETHICVQGEPCRKFFIINPKWIVTLKTSLDAK